MNWDWTEPTKGATNAFTEQMDLAKILHRHQNLQTPHGLDAGVLGRSCGIGGSFAH